VRDGNPADNWRGLADKFMLLSGRELKNMMSFISENWPEAKKGKWIEGSHSIYGDQLLEIARGHMLNDGEEKAVKTWLVKELLSISHFTIDLATGEQKWTALTSFVLEGIASDR
ncbi:hypothetical protein PMAYCL1PPCAC_01406, partial [Pristionchus mayeri]